MAGCEDWGVAACWLVITHWWWSQSEESHPWHGPHPGTVTPDNAGHSSCPHLPVDWVAIVMIQCHQSHQAGCGHKGADPISVLFCCHSLTAPGCHQLRLNRITHFTSSIDVQTTSTRVNSRYNVCWLFTVSSAPTMRVYPPVTLCDAPNPIVACYRVSIVCSSHHPHYQHTDFSLLTGKLYSLQLASAHTLGSEGTSGDVSVICDMGRAGELGSVNTGPDCQIFIGHAKFNINDHWS